MPNSNWPEFERLVAIETDECVCWTKGLTAGGYAACQKDGRRQYLHAVACEMANGPRPVVPGVRIETAHSCGVRSCINPRHLRWATAAENSADKIQHGTTNRGERSASSRLTEHDVRAIRAARKAGRPLKTIAAQYGVAISTVANITYRTKWAWLPD